MFRNATLFRIPLSLARQLGEIAATSGDGSLQAHLAEHPLKPVGPLELSSSGFVSPYGQGSESLVQLSTMPIHAIRLTVGSESKVLPGSAVNSALEKKLKALEEQEGRKPGGRARKRIKEDLIHEMLPKAFVKPGRTDFYIDIERGWVVVDSASRKSAESAVSELRHALGSFPALPANAEADPAAILTSWISGAPMPEGMSLGDEAQMQDAAGGGIVRVSKQELRSDEIDKCLEAGKRVSRLGVAFDDRLSCVLGADLVLRKVKLLDGAMDTLESMERDDLNAELDARFVLMTATYAPVLTLLESQLQLSKAESDA